MIKVENVSMRFRMGSDNIMSLKEMLIAKATKKVSYKDFWVFKDINFEVKKGEVVGIIGRNGAGKSTILKIISGILQPTEGKVSLGGRVVPMLELGSGFDFDLTGRENIFLNGAILGYSEEFLKEKYDEILEFSELGEFIETPIRNYSSGMMMRLAFSIATIVEPEILIVDEILAVGDEAFQKKSKRKMLELMGGGTTVLFVSHSIAQIREMCNRVVWLEKGKIKMEGEAKFICDEYQKYINPTGEVQDKKHKASDAPRNLSDVLFVYGDDEDKYEWRVTNQREQLLAGTVPSNEIYYKDINDDVAKLYRSYIFVNCCNTDRMQSFIKKIKSYNKKIYFDFSYCGNYSEVDPQEMLLEDMSEYCDGVIVSNRHLENKYKTKGYNTFNNPLVVTEQFGQFASWAIYDRDVLPFLDKKDLSEDELINYNKAVAVREKRKENDFVIGFFINTLASKEFEFIKETICEILDKNNKIQLVVADTQMHIPDSMKRLSNQIRFVQTNSQEDLIRAMSEVDLQILTASSDIEQDNLNIYNIYAELVKVSTVVVVEEQLDISIKTVNLDALKKYILEFGIKSINQFFDYEGILDKYTSIGTGDVFSQYIRKDMTKNMVFVCEDNGVGGNNWLACQHAIIAKSLNYDVSMIVTGKNYRNIIFYNQEIPVISRDTTYAYQYMEKIVSYDWNSARWMQNYSNVTERYYLVNGDETYKLKIGDTMRFYANQMYTPHTKVNYLTVSNKVKVWLERKYGLEVTKVPLGVKPSSNETCEYKQNDKLKLLVIGDGRDSSDNLDEAFEIIEALDRERYHISFYAYGKQEKYNYDVDEYYYNISQSEIENLYFEMDVVLCTCVAKDVMLMLVELMKTNCVPIIKNNYFVCEELIHEFNSLMYDDVEDAKKCLYLIEKRDYLNSLKNNARTTADKFGWGSMEEQIKNIYNI